MTREIGGVDIGSLGDSRQEVISIFYQQGVKVSPKSIPHLRAGRMPGDILAERAACASMLNSGSPIKKDQLYERIARISTLQDIRRPQVRYPHRFSSIGFTARLADALDLPRILVDEILRAMRTEAVMITQEGMQSDLFVGFNTRVKDFLGNYDDPYALKKSPTLQMLMEMRGDFDFTPDNFYRAIYEHPSNRFLGAWVTNEVDWLTQFYAARLQPPMEFSPLDKEVLDKTRQGEQALLLPRLSQQTGIRVNRQIIEAHTNALLGQFKIKE